MIHKLYALSYVPPDQVIPLYKEHIIPEIEDKIDSDKDWSEQAEDLEEFGFYYENTWIEKRSGRSPLFPVELWNHYQTILDDGVATNNMLESFNRTWNKLAGKSPNVWELREIMVKQEAEARRTFLKNSVGADMSTNTGRKERSLSNNARLKFLVSSCFNTTPKKDYIQMVAHELMRS